MAWRLKSLTAIGKNGYKRFKRNLLKLLPSAGRTCTCAWLPCFNSTWETMKTGAKMSLKELKYSWSRLLAIVMTILVSNPLPGSFVTYVGADDFEIGYREARYLFENLGGKGKIVVIEGTPAAPTNRERVRGYQRAFAEFPGIQVLGSGTGNYQQPDARRVMEKFLTEHKEIDAVLSANDSMALGVLEALKAANRTAIVIGINGILPAVKEIETGAILATVDFNMFKIGCTATRAAVRHLKHEPLPEKVILPAEVIDKTNYRAWLVPVDQRACPEWSEVAR